MTHTANRNLALAGGRRSAASSDWKPLVFWGYGFIGCTLGVFLLWALIARLDGAALASGIVSVESNRKTLQHLEGGIVRDIAVKDGELVREGQLLISLDPTRTESTGHLYRNQFAIALAQEARLLSERDGADAVVFPQAVMELAGIPAIVRAMHDQREQFIVRRQVLAQSIEVANAQIEQANKEAEQNDIDNNTAKAMLASLKRELESVRFLFERNLVALSRLSALEREEARLEGVIANTEVGKTRLREKIHELTGRRDKATKDYRQEAATQLGDLQKSITELRQQIIIASDTHRRVELRAPITGAVQQLRIFTVGGVVRAGEPILDIVPISDSLVIKAKVSPLDADRVTVNMDAEIRFPSFRILGLQIIRGKVSAMSRDRLVDEVTRDPYFDAQIRVEREALPTAIADKLVAGMPAEVVIPTGERTVFNYLVTPIVERFQNSMRER